VTWSALARYARRSELRRHAVAAVALAGAGAATLRAAGLESAQAALLAGITAIVGAAMIPLAAAGLDARADWVWRLAPVRPSWLFARFALASLLAAGAVTAAGVAVTWTIAPIGPRLLASAAAAAAVVFGGALLAGALVPPRKRAGDAPLAALALFAAVAGSWSFVLGWGASKIGAEAGSSGALLAVGSLAGAVSGATALRAKSLR
jgi:hypothetical protein